MFAWAQLQGSLLQSDGAFLHLEAWEILAIDSFFSPQWAGLILAVLDCSGTVSLWGSHCSLSGGWIILLAVLLWGLCPFLICFNSFSILWGKIEWWKGEPRKPSQRTCNHSKAVVQLFPTYILYHYLPNVRSTFLLQRKQSSVDV